jgi:hypothetical protein
MKKFFLGCLGVTIGAASLGIWRLHQRTSQLEFRAAELRRSVEAPAAQAQVAEERDELQRLHALVAQIKQGGLAASVAVTAEVERARREISALETAAQRAASALPNRTSEIEENRDPEKALARLEYFQNAGRSSPEAVVQTTVWAALKGDAATLASCVTTTDEARHLAVNWLSSLPPEARGKYPSPESLAALILSDEILKSAAAEIKGYTPRDDNHGFVTIKALESGDQPIRLEVERGNDDWKIIISDRAMTALRNRIGEIPAATTR